MGKFEKTVLKYFEEMKIMKGLKTIVGLLVALTVFMMPLAVSATGDASDVSGTDTSSTTSDSSSIPESTEEFSLTLECKVNGNVPLNTEFVFSVTTGDYIWDAVENLKPADNFVINTTELTDGKKEFPFPDTVTAGGVYYKIKLLSVSNTHAIVDPIEIEVYFAETGAKVEILKDGLPIEEFVDEPATVTFNCTTAASVGVSTEGCEAFTKVYDGKLTATLTDKNYKLNGVADGDEVKLTFEKAEYNSADVKSASKITVSGLRLEGKDAAKYGLSTETFEVNGTVTPRPLIVTADNLVMTAGQDEPSLTYKVSEDLIKGNKVIGALVRAAGNEVGTYTVSRGTLSFGDNYEITFIEGSLTISNFSFAEVKDPTSSVKISGYFDPSATVKVTALDPESEVYTVLANCTGGNKIVSSYDILFTNNGFDGELTLAIPVESKYEGKEFAIYQQMSNGSIACYKTTAIGGFIAIKTSECSQFMLVTDTEKVDDGSSVGMTILKVIIIILAVIIGLALIIALFFFGMIFFNKTEQLKSIIRAFKKMLKK